MGAGSIETFEFQTGRDQLGTQRVYVRHAWAADWKLEKHLHCVDCAWSKAPSMPAAALQWIYGPVIHPDAEPFWITYGKQKYRRFYVKIEFDTMADEIGAGGQVETWKLRTWYGYVELTEDAMGGLKPSFELGTENTPIGTQTFFAVGMEALLLHHVVFDAWWDNDGTPERMEISPAFNADGIPNRTAAKVLDTYLFEPCLEDAKPWNSNDIVEYLLAYQVPVDGLTEAPPFLWTVLGAEHLNWDRPVLTQYGVPTYVLIERLLNRRRLLMWHTVYNEDDDTFDITVDTMTATPIPIGLTGASPVPANDRCLHLSFDNDPLTTGVIKDSTMTVYDQVIVQSERRISIGTFMESESFVAAWDTNEEASFSSGMKFEGSDGTRTKQMKTAEWRGRKELEHVYSRFVIKSGCPSGTRWNFTLGGNPMFPVSSSGGTSKLYWPEMNILEDLGFMYEGQDYSGGRIAAGTIGVGIGELAAPVVFMLRPQNSRWVAVDTIGLAAGLEINDLEKDWERFSISISVPQDRRIKGVTLHVNGSPQWVLDAKNFQRQPHDEKLGEWTWKDDKMMVTLAIEDQRYAEAKYPTALPGHRDALRFKLIRVPGYRHDYVVPGTVVGVDDEGALVTSEGGYVPKPGRDDDLARLAALARIAGGWYTKTHQLVKIESHRLIHGEAVDLGDMIVGVGLTITGVPIAGGHYRTGIDSPVSEIRFLTPRGTEDSPPRPIMIITTFAGELDALQMQPPEVDPDIMGRRPTNRLDDSLSIPGYHPFIETWGAAAYDSIMGAGASAALEASGEYIPAGGFMSEGILRGR